MCWCAVKFSFIYYVGTYTHIFYVGYIYVWYIFHISSHRTTDYVTWLTRCHGYWYMLYNCILLWNVIYFILCVIFIYLLISCTFYFKHLILYYHCCLLAIDVKRCKKDVTMCNIYSFNMISVMEDSIRM